MKLTYDTLLHVISLTWSAKESMQLMATCRVLYHEGAKIALKKPIIIFNGQQLASFLRFLRAENLSRCRFLRHLRLWAFDLEPEGVQELIETLPHLVGIEYLRLESAEELLQPNPTLALAFAALTSLRRIELSGAKEVTCGLLSALQSPLISVYIDFLPDDDVKMWDVLDSDKWSIWHPTKVLANFAATLEEAEWIAWFTNEDTIIPQQVFPNVRKLAIELHEFPLRIDSFIRAFPNLTGLNVATEYHGGTYSEDMRESHDANVAQQLDPINSCGTWARLEYFSGSLFDLYAIGLAFHIPRVSITSTQMDGQMVDVLATVLRYARPVHLKLGGIAGSMLGDIDRGFISMLRHASASSLINLEVCIYFGEDDREKDLAEALSNLFMALGLLPLKFLELRVYTRELDPTPKGDSAFLRQLRAQQGLPQPPDPVPAPLTPAELSLDALDKEALVDCLAESLTTLEAAHLLIFSSRRGEGGFERSITKERSITDTSRPAGREQWHM